LKRDAAIIMGSSIASFLIALFETAWPSALGTTIERLEYYLSIERIEGMVITTIAIFVILGALYLILGMGFFLMGKKKLIHVGSILSVMSFMAGAIYFVISKRLLDLFGTKSTLEVLRITSEIKGFQIALIAVPLVLGLVGIFSGIKTEIGALEFFGFSLIFLGKLGALLAIIEMIANPNTYYAASSLTLLGGFHTLLIFVGYILIGLFIWKNRQTTQ